MYLKLYKNIFKISIHAVVDVSYQYLIYKSTYTYVPVYYKLTTNLKIGYLKQPSNCSIMGV